MTVMGSAASARHKHSRSTDAKTVARVEVVQAQARENEQAFADSRVGCRMCEARAEARTRRDIQDRPG